MKIACFRPKIHQLAVQRVNTDSFEFSFGQRVIKALRFRL